jgi:selenocysteine-specific elongation factor
MGKAVVAAATWREWLERVPVELAAYHRDAPLRSGLAREELRGRARIPVVAFGPLLATLAADGRVIDMGTVIRLPDHQVSFTPEQAAAVSRLMALFAERGVLSPSVKECKAIAGDDVYQALVELGTVRPVAEDVVYDAETYDRLIALLTGRLRGEGMLSPADAREMLGISRKYAIALLEHMDELRLTRREGDIRKPARRDWEPERLGD